MILFAALAFAGSSRADNRVWTQQDHYVLAIGERAVVYAVPSGTCGGDAPPFRQVFLALPTSLLGTFSDGGIVWRTSVACPGIGRGAQGILRPARAIVFSGSRPGTETLQFLSDHVAITVVRR